MLNIIFKFDFYAIFLNLNSDITERWIPIEPIDLIYLTY